MKPLNLKHFSLLVMLILFVAQVNSQSYNYLRILKSFPPLPDNTLTASEEEKEIFNEKLSDINTLLWDLEDEEKEEIRIAETKPYPFGADDLDKLDAAEKEIDLLLDQIADVIEQYTEKTIELRNQYSNILDSVQTLNQTLISKLESASNKDQIYKQLYTNRLNAYKKLDAEHRENIRFLLTECEKLTPVINKLDDYTIDGHKISYNKPGLQLLQNIYKSMEWAFLYNAGDGKEKSPFDAALMMQQMFNNK